MSRNNFMCGIAVAIAIANAVAIAGVLAMVAAPTPAHAAGALTLDNRLQACVAMQPGKRAVEHGVLLQDVTLDIRKPIGECGCKSAVMGYASRAVLDGGAHVLLLQGRLNARKSGARTLPLASDTTLAGDLPIAATFECAPAD